MDYWYGESHALSRASSVVRAYSFEVGLGNTFITLSLVMGFEGTNTACSARRGYTAKGWAQHVLWVTAECAGIFCHVYVMYFVHFETYGSSHVRGRPHMWQ